MCVNSFITLLKLLSFIYLFCLVQNLLPLVIIVLLIKNPHLVQLMNIEYSLLIDYYQFYVIHLYFIEFFYQKFYNLQTPTLV